MAESSVAILIPAIADALAAAADLPRPEVATAEARCALWAHDADDSLAPVDADGPAAYTTLRAFPSAPASWGRPRTGLQGATVAPTAIAAMTQCERVFNAMLDDDGHGGRVPRREWAINGFVVSVYRLVFGGIVAVDPKTRWNTCVFNCEVAYRAASTNP